MLRLAKYLKPYLWMILLCIVLLFIQANADLALPDYMSRIVNNGIQQGGIENSVPQAIRKSEMERVALFIPPADLPRVLANYTLVQPDSAGSEPYLAKYPLLEKEAVYVLKAITPEESSWMNPVMARGLLAVSGIEQALADPAKAAAMSASSGFDLSKLPEGTDLFAMLARLPAETRLKMQESMDKQFAALGESMVSQAGMRVVKTEYEAIGVDTAKLETDYILRTGGVMLLITLLSVVCAIAVSYLSARTAAGTARDLRKSIFQKVESFSSAEFDHFSTASLITRSTNDITQIQMVVIMMIRMVFYAPIMGVGGIIRAIGKDSSMWWLIAVAVVMLLGLVVIVFSLSLPKFKIMQSLMDRLNLVARENLSGMMVIRAFNMQPFEAQRFDKANKDLTGTTLFVTASWLSCSPA